MGAATRTEQPGNTYLNEWELTNGDATGSPIKIPGGSDKTVDIDGSIGTATVFIEGSNEPGDAPSSWKVLHDFAGNALTFTAAGIAAIAENPLHIRARMTGTAGGSVFARVLSKSR